MLLNKYFVNSVPSIEVDNEIINAYQTTTNSDINQQSGTRCHYIFF